MTPTPKEFFKILGKCLEICNVLVDSIILKEHIYCSFLQMWREWVGEWVSFCGPHKYITLFISYFISISYIFNILCLIYLFYQKILWLYKFLPEHSTFWVLWWKTKTKVLLIFQSFIWDLGRRSLYLYSFSVIVLKMVKFLALLFQIKDY